MAASIASLPSELLSHILSIGFASDFDLPYLWCTLRHVNRRFRDTIEALTARNYLRKTYLTFTVENPDVEARVNHPKIKFWLSFQRLSSDSGESCKAIFTPDKYINASPEDPVWFSLVQESITSIERDVLGLVKPAHMISCVRCVNDTSLVDFEMMDISIDGHWGVRLDWKATLSNLLIEEQLRQTLSRKWIKEQSIRSRATPLTGKSTEHVSHAMRLHILSNRMTRDESFQIARQKRIAAEYAAFQKKQTMIGTHVRSDLKAGASRTMDFLEFLDANNREAAFAMRRKAEEIEDVQSFMNQFSFD